MPPSSTCTCTMRTCPARARPPGIDRGPRGRILRVVCGPFVRYVSNKAAVIWMELSYSSEVTVALYRGSRLEKQVSAKTFQVGSRHYALVALERLRSSTWYEYEIYGVPDGGGTRACLWPIRGSLGPLPRSTFQTFSMGQGRPLRVVYVSCRTPQIYEDLSVREEGDTEEVKSWKEKGVDALKLYARRLLAEYRLRRLRWPHLILMTGDQVYADILSPQMRTLVDSSRQGTDLPRGEVIAFEEYAKLYNEAWRDEDVRWLLSCIPSLMIFDDHEIIDDWNISKKWLNEKKATDWWYLKYQSALAAYWLYQGLGNLPPDEWRSDERMRAITLPASMRKRDVTHRVTSLFRAYATGLKRVQWGYTFDAGGTSVVVADCRARRDVLKRKMMDDDEWNWFAQAVRTSKRPNLLIVLSLPFLLPEAIHELETISSKYDQFPWNLDPAAQTLGPMLQEKIDLEHWSAFPESFNRMLDLIEEILTMPGQRKRLVALISGDVHFSYNMKGSLVKNPGRHFYQLVSSPVRHKVTGRDEAIVRALSSPVASIVLQAAQAIAVAFGFVPGISLFAPNPQSVTQKARVKWDPIQTGNGWIWFGNFIATLKLLPNWMECVYERAGVSKTTRIESGKEPKILNEHRLSRIASFSETLT